MAEPFGYDALIIVTPRDFERVSSLHERILRYLPSKRVCYVGSDDLMKMVDEKKLSVAYCSELEGKLDCMNENDILRFDDVYSVMADIYRKNGEEEKPYRGAVGWYYQQFLKMSYAYLCEDEYYMVWDGDTVPCVEFSMFEPDVSRATEDIKNVTELHMENLLNKKPYLDVKSEYEKRYFDTISKILPGMKKVIGHSFIAEHMLFRVDLMQKLIKKIESNDKLEGESYWEKILRCIPVRDLRRNSFSEFETYGTFAALTSPDTYKIREWHSLRYGGLFYDINTISERDFNWLGRDFFAVSFEKSHHLADDHKNIFDNPYYQERFTARQVLEAVQEEFEEGMKEVWWDENKTGEKKEKESVVFNTAFPNPGSLAISQDEYEIYKRMGDELLVNNPDKAYLCYENAVFLCGDDKERKKLEDRLNTIRDNYPIRVKKTSFVIVSYNAKIFMQQCLKCIHDHCIPGTYDIIVVDNASDDGIREWIQEECPYDLSLVLADENLGFAAGCNAGIKIAAPDTDIFLLNNDTRITRNALFWMKMALYDSDSIGATGAVSNYCDPCQRVNILLNLPEEYVEYGAKRNVPMNNSVEEKSILSGFAMLIRSEVIDEIGGFDEDFSPGYFEDTDYCMRIRETGRVLLLCQNAFIYHAGSQSFIKRDDLKDFYAKNRKLFIRKWGFDKERYCGVSEEQMKLIDEIRHGRNDYFRVLVKNAGCGDFSAWLKRRYPNVMIFGIESNVCVVRHSLKSVPVFCVGEDDMMSFGEDYFDYVFRCTNAKS